MSGGGERFRLVPLTTTAQQGRPPLTDPTTITTPPLSPTPPIGISSSPKLSISHLTPHRSTPLLKDQFEFRTAPTSTASSLSSFSYSNLTLDHHRIHSSASAANAYESANTSVPTYLLCCNYLKCIVCSPCWLFRVFISLFQGNASPTPRSFYFPVYFEHRRIRKRLYTPNALRNQKYTAFTFIPSVLYEQFKYFFNLYFLLVSVSQFIPTLQVGYALTYFGPLVFVLMITMTKEAIDDWKRRCRDLEANGQHYPVLNPLTGTFMHIPSSDLVVGDLVQITKNQRVPADVVLLKTQDRSGSCFLRTDQLDGETDWKLKLALPITHNLGSDYSLVRNRMIIDAEPPNKDIHLFSGNLSIPTSIAEMQQAGPQEPHAVEPITTDNMLWMNTVLASPDPVLGCVVYTGADTRAVMNTNIPRAKLGLLDSEVNNLSKILFLVTVLLSGTMVYLSGLNGSSLIHLTRFLILFSSIIPISLRVNLDMGKLFYAQQIARDSEIPNTIVRTSTIPEELGRIEYLLSDKTGTLTRNEMDLKKVHLGTMCFASDSFDEMRSIVASAFSNQTHSNNLSLSPILATSSQFPNNGPSAFGAKRMVIKSRDMSNRSKDIALALALCHNVNLTVSEVDGSISLQAASPDEIALVRWAQSMGISLLYRDPNTLRLGLPNDQTVEYEIIHVFPFTSESKRMGIVLRESDQTEALFIQKGADSVMAQLVQFNDWLDEECSTMSREGLRTLVVARKRISAEQLSRFNDAYHQAKTVLTNRAETMQQVVATHLEHDLEILGVTGVEDRLQEDVRPTLEALRNAGIKVWMLTGDKVETATCIALSSKLVSRQQTIFTIYKVKSALEADEELDRLQGLLDACLIIDGESLAFCLEFTKPKFLSVATRLPAVVCCRCSPTQKAQVTEFIKEYTGCRVCCIGDGGNDVSMIQAAHVGIGIVGKEGKQASLAADFSITGFSHLTRLILWHGRNSYQRSAKLAHFVIHRGLVISVMQAVYSSLYFFEPIALYQGMLLVGYTTIFTMFPVFSLVLDHDISSNLALLFPELYKDLVKGQKLSYKSFFIWLAISIYQGGAIMMFALMLFNKDYIHVVAISFTALIFNELVMVALEIVTWHRYMIWAQVGTLVIYLVSMAILPDFDREFILTWSYVWKTLCVTAISSMPLFVFQRLQFYFAPPSYQKLVNHH